MKHDAVLATVIIITANLFLSGAEGVAVPDIMTVQSAGRINDGGVVATQTDLPDGRVLVSGLGYYDEYLNVIRLPTRIYNPATHSWSTVSQLVNQGWYRQRVGMPIADGRIVFVGQGDIYNPSTDQWTYVQAPGDANGAYCQVMAKLPDGRLLATGIGTYSGANTFIFDPISSVWSSTCAQLQNAKGECAVTTFGNGALLVGGAPGPQQSWFYDASADTWTQGPSIVPFMSYPPILFNLSDGRVATTSGGHRGISVLSADGSAWTDIQTSIPVYPVWRDGNPLIMRLDNDTLIWNGGYYNPRTGHGGTFAALPGIFPHRISANRLLWIATDGSCTEMNLKAAAQDVVSTPVHWRGASKSITLSALSFDDAVTWTVASPAHGTCTGTPPSLIYTPDQSFVGIDTFAYTANDATWGTGRSATVTIQITNGPPTTNDGAASFNQDTVCTGTLPGSDPDGDALTWAITTPPEQGTFTITNASTGAFQFVMPAGIFSDTHIGFSVTDGMATATGTLTLSINRVNQMPSCTPGPDVAVAESSQLFTAPHWIRGFSPGPSYESDQIATAYTVTNNHPELFAQQPAISLDGSLTFMPNSRIDATTMTTLSITVQDNGGTLNGGNDTSAPVTAYITMSPVLDVISVSTTADSGTGSFRDGLMRAYAGDTITFDPTVFSLANSSAATIINVLSALPTIAHDNITIDGSNAKVAINGSGAGTANGLTITANNVTIMGLAIVGFTGSGISVEGAAAGNQLGGDRRVGTGPNGRGLRIAGNGAYGIHLNGSGCTDTHIIGCWIGLNAAGTMAEPNLAGVLIDGGSHHNWIGNGTAGGSCRVAGNTFEGIVISGDGSDDNHIIGNVIGGTRDWVVGNGASGIFISRGTRGTKVGASGDGTDDTANANDIRGNGEHGIEIRTTSSIGNSSHANRFSGNLLGAIGLFDGCNLDVQPPSGHRTETRGATRKEQFQDGAVTHAASASEPMALLSGSAPGLGTVEVYSDTGTQGANFIGRAAVVNGIWSLSASVDPSSNITATYTDTLGNTSAFITLSMGTEPQPATQSQSTTIVNNSTEKCGLGGSMALLFCVLSLAFLPMRPRKQAKAYR